MATIIEENKNFTIECSNCGTKSIYNIDEKDVSISEYNKNETANCALPIEIYNNHIEEIKTKFEFYQRLGYKGKLTKRDVCLSVDKKKRIYKASCPKCGHRISKIEIIETTYYIKIFPPDEPEFEDAEIQWILLNNDEINKSCLFVTTSI